MSLAVMTPVRVSAVLPGASRWSAQGWPERAWQGNRMTSIEPDVTAGCLASARRADTSGAAS